MEHLNFILTFSVRDMKTHVPLSSSTYLTYFPGDASHVFIVLGLKAAIQALFGSVTGLDQELWVY